MIILVLFFMIVAAVVALYTEQLLSAVIALGAVGFGSSGIFLLLRAPDLAITQVVVEVITLILLIRATMVVGSIKTEGRQHYLPYLLACLVVILLTAFVFVSFREMPEFGNPVMERFEDAPSIYYLLRGFDLTGSANQVMSILLDFRAYDTLGEATVIFTAVLGALTLLRTQGRKKLDEG